MAQMPMPAPPLDGVPPSDPSLGASQNPNPSVGQLAGGGSASMAGSMQVVQMTLQAAAQAASLIDLLGQINPGFAPVAADIIQRLRGGLNSALQQGSQPSAEPSLGMLSGAGQPTQGPPQQPLPSLPNGIQ